MLLMRVARAVGAMANNKLSELQRQLFDGDFRSAADAADNIERRQTKKERQLTPTNVIQFPIWPEPDRAAPNALLRSALFGVVGRGERQYCKHEKLAAWPGTELVYTGQRLDQCDEDIWLQLVQLHQIQGVAPGGKVTFTARSFLKALGRSYGSGARERLYGSITRLEACAVSLSLNIEGRELEYISSLVQEAAREKGTDRWGVVLNPKLLPLFAPGHFSRFDWETRLLLRTDLARWLQGYIASHAATAKHPHRIGLERLRELSGARSVMKQFRFNVRGAMAELERRGLVQSWSITAGDALELVRPNKPAGHLPR